MTASTVSVGTAGIHSVDHFALEVPRLDEAREFLTAFGFRVQEEEGQLLLRTAGSAHVWARIFAGTRKRLAYLSLNCFADDFSKIRAQIIEAGGQEATPRIESAKHEGFWFEDPDGNLLQLKAGPKTSPNFKPPRDAEPALPRLRGAVARENAEPVQPLRLAHVVMFTPDIRRTVSFYERSVGVRLSDGSEGIVAFMHAPHGSDHHMIAFVQGAAKGWHHSAWDVPDVNHVGLGQMQMQRAGYRDGWGVGRHVLGSNYFHYVRDPWGSFWEYSADIDFIAPGGQWAGGNHPPDDSLYLWGPDVPGYFFENTEDGVCA
ncbi:VOC family protein [Paraburkholderia sp. RL17-347-BIC-D]|uniref:VOC family protein n=1 Tax=Paraburkholderia sp. RL17-347-BIC-D TaxID=3031632 RepID=UPI0038BB41EF